MSNYFRPDAYYKNLASIDPSEHINLGYKVAIFDFDNTLSKHGSSQSNAYANKQIERWQQAGFKVYLISNAKQDRADILAKDISVKLIGDAKKPSTKAFEKVQNLAGSKKAEMIYYGDQVFTDVLAARRFGIAVVLVDPLSRNEPFYIKLKRLLESFLKQLLSFTDYFDDLIAGSK